MVQTGVQPLPEQKAEKRPVNPGVVASDTERWLRSLRRCFNGFSQNVVFDVRATNVAPEAAFLNSSDTSIWSEKEFANLIGQMCYRQSDLVQHTWVFHKTAFVAGTDSLRQCSWLEHLKGAELKALCGDGLSFYDLSPQSQTFLARNMPIRGLQNQISQGKFVSVQIRLMFRATGKSAKGETIDIPMLIGDRLSLAATEARERLEKQFHPLVKPYKVGPHPSGALDFSKGEIVTLESLIDKASKAFGLKYLGDSRLGQSILYLQGKFNEQNFKEAVAMVYTPIPFQQVDDRLEKRRAGLVADLRSQIATTIDPKYIPKGLSLGEVFKGVSYSPDELVKIDSGLAFGFSRYGLD